MVSWAVSCGMISGLSSSSALIGGSTVSPPSLPSMTLPPPLARPSQWTTTSTRVTSIRSINYVPTT